MKKSILLAPVVLAVAALGCLPVRDSDESLLRDPSFHIMVNDETTIPSAATFDFSTKLFKVADATSIDLAAVDERLVGAFEAELARKQYRRVRAEPDILVRYAVAVDAPISADDFDEAYAEEFPLEIPAEPSPAELHYHQGALVVDFVDRRSGTLLWRGAISAGLEDDLGESAKERRIREAVRTLLAHFPLPVRATATAPSDSAP